MDYYIFNTNLDKNGKHEVHIDNCPHKPELQNIKSIGYCTDCKDAIIKAKTNNPGKTFDGCAYCCPACHRG